MLTKQQIQDTVIDNLSLHIQDQITIRARISEAFTKWFQDAVMIPKDPAAEEGGGEQGQGGAAPPEDTSGGPPPEAA